MLKPIRLMTAVGTGPTLDAQYKRWKNAAEKIWTEAPYLKAGSRLSASLHVWLAWFINSKFYVAQSFSFRARNVKDGVRHCGGDFGEHASPGTETTR